MKTSGFALGFQLFSRDLANVNEWKIMFDPSSENAHVKDGHICDKKQYLFQEKLLLIAPCSCTTTKYCESKSDIYSLLIRINLFK